MKTCSLIVRMSYEVYYQLSFAKSIDEKTKEKVARYLENEILNSLQKIYEISEDFIVPSRFYNVATELKVVKRRKSNPDDVYDECGVWMYGDHGEILLEFVAEAIKNKKGLDFTRFIIDDILSKTGYLAEDVGNILFIGATELIRHYLMFRLGKVKTREPDINELTASVAAYCVGLNRFIKGYVYFDAEEIKEKVDKKFGPESFESLVRETDRDAVKRMVDRWIEGLSKEEMLRFKKFLRRTGYKMEGI